MQPRKKLTQPTRKQDQRTVKSISPVSLTHEEIAELDALEKTHNQLLHNTVKTGTYLILPQLYYKLLILFGPVLLNKVFNSVISGLYKNAIGEAATALKMAGGARLSEKEIFYIVQNLAKGKVAEQIAIAVHGIYYTSRYLLLDPIATRIATKYFSPIANKKEELRDPFKADTRNLTLRKRNKIYNRVNKGISYIAALYTLYTAYALVKELLRLNQDAHPSKLLTLFLEILITFSLARFSNNVILANDEIIEKLSILRINLNKTLRSSQQNRWKQGQEKTLEACSFRLEIESYENISSRDVKKILLSIYGKFGIPVKQAGKSTLYLNGYFNLTEQLADDIQKSLSQSLHRLSQIRYLRGQLTKLTSQYQMSYLALEDIETASCEFIITLDSNKQANDMRNILSSALGAKVLENGTLIVNRAISLSVEQFNDLQTLLKAATKTESSDVNFHSSMTTPDSPKGKYRMKKDPSDSVTPTTPNIRPPISTTPHVKKEKIRIWQAGTSADKDVYKIEGTTIPQDRFWVKSELTEDDFFDEAQYKKFNDKMRYTTFAGPKGQEGLCLVSGKQRTPDGEEFKYQGKFKLLGDNGDCRVYCELQKSETGEALFVAKGIKQKTH